MQYPDKVRITEVGPRDGFQNIETFISTDIKMKVIGALLQAGIRSIEVTSFVHPKAVPQMADSADVFSRLIDSNQLHEITAYALVPNLKGAQNAWLAGARHLAYVVSASESHNLANVRRSRDQSMDELLMITRELPGASIKLSLAMAFGCPFEGAMADETVMDLIQRAMTIGVKEIVLCDTIGVANPKQVYRIAKEALTRFPATFSLHLHNTRGMGLANTLAGMDAGISIFETSAGGLGGCPFAPGAAGNTATEDLVNMLESMGINTGIHLTEYLQAVALIKERVKSILNSSMITARQYDLIK